MSIHQWKVHLIEFVLLLVINQHNVKTEEAINITESINNTDLYNNIDYYYNTGRETTIDTFEPINKTEIINITETFVATDVITSAQSIYIPATKATIKTIEHDMHMTHEGFLLNPVKEMNDYHNKLIDYITYLFCYDGSYRFIHIYVERSLSTALADELIIRLNQCMTAGVLTSR